LPWPAFAEPTEPVTRIAQAGVGIAYFVTGLPGDPPRGRSAFREAEEKALGQAVKLISR